MTLGSPCLPSDSGCPDVRAGGPRGSERSPLENLNRMLHLCGDFAAAISANAAHTISWSGAAGEAYETTPCASAGTATDGLPSDFKALAAKTREDCATLVAAQFREDGFSNADALAMGKVRSASAQLRCGASCQSCLG